MTYAFRAARARSRADADGRPTAKTAPAGGDIATEYHEAGNVTILNRLTSQSQAAGVLVYDLGYDAKNRLVSLADPTGVRTQGYETAGRLTSVSRAGQTLSCGFDADSNISSRTWPDGQHPAYTYDLFDRLTLGGQYFHREPSTLRHQGDS
ncbi:YD repeat-containing protein [Hamadaea flava]|uniref:YD repeat-containing protein n=1 Tax=Hamadaea flava TaxID=1742688 RepID=A0ABV8LQN2_9ACTN|nr:hypothetical protein [Hamadaea flava]MCP2323297.1 YD repeat-containing protein [Hamadaea flava]